jgi:hypothetical protein
MSIGMNLAVSIFFAYIVRFRLIGISKILNDGKRETTLSSR